MRQRNGAIVILCAGYGDGHVQVSRTLKRKFGELGFGHVRIVDLFREAHPAMDAFSKFLYARSPAWSELGLDYYGWSYYLTRDMKTGGMMSKWLGTFGLHKLTEVLDGDRPLALISTFPFSGVFEHVRRSGIAVPTFTVITDFTLHNRWLSSTPDHFFAATEDLKRAMMERGVPERRITVTGIPIRDAFYETGAAAEKPTSSGGNVLIMAGAFGVLRDIRSMAARVLELGEASVTIVCGRNEPLKRELEAWFGAERRVAVYGYVERVDELMRYASCMITKAGGVTLAEAIQIGIPTLIYKPFSGQEKENAIYLEQQGFARITHNMNQLADQVSLMLERGRMGWPRTNIRPPGKAAGDIADRVIRSIGASIAEPVPAGASFDPHSGWRPK